MDKKGGVTARYSGDKPIEPCVHYWDITKKHKRDAIKIGPKRTMQILYVLAICRKCGAEKWMLGEHPFVSYNEKKAFKAKGQ